MKLLRVMRLWKPSGSGRLATAVWTGYSLIGAYNFIDRLGPQARDGRLWIDYAEKPSFKGY